MPVFTNVSQLPRQELALAILEGEGSVGGCIGDKILPDFPITRRTAHLIKATLKDTQALRIFSAADKYIRQPGAEYERLVATLGDDTISVVLRALEIVVPNESQKDYDGYMDIVSFFAARFGREYSRLSKEYLIAQAIFNTSNFGSATNSVNAYTAANATYAAFTGASPTGISFIADVIAATRLLKAAGEPPPYSVVLSGPVYERVRQAFSVSQYVNGIFGAQQLATNAQILAALREFGVTELLIGDAYYNTAADQATPVLTQIWSNTYVWVGRPGLAKNIGSPSEPTPEENTEEGLGVPILGGVGCLAYWESFGAGGVIASGDLEGETYPGGNYVEIYPDLIRDSMIIRVKMSSNPYIGNTRAGTLIATQYS